MIPHIKGCKLPEEHDGICRNGMDRPLIVQPDGKVLSYQRVTNFTKTLDDQSSLMTWKQWTTTLGVLADTSLLDECRALADLDMSDPAVKKRRNDLMEQAMIAGGGSRKADRGTLVHGYTEILDRGEPLLDVPEDVDPDLMAYEHATADLEHRLIESFVVNDELKAAGTPDRVSFVPVPDPSGVVGNKIVDLKTGSLGFPHSMAMQLSVYSRSVLYSPDFARQAFDMGDGFGMIRGPLPEVSQDWGVIVHAPAGAGQATLHWIDLAAAWDAVQVAKQVKAWRSNKTLLTQV